MSPHATDPGKVRRDRLIFRTATPVGAALMVLGQIGARTGVVALPADPHHVATQLLGGALLVWGLTRWR
jgi:hypothetical protein